METYQGVHLDTAVYPETRRVIPKRVALASAALLACGAAAGASAGILGSVLWAGLFPSHNAFNLGVFVVAGIIGAPLGAALLPLAGFTILRYVPIGKALWQTILGAAIGGVIGVQFLTHAWIVGPVAGFALAATRLWGITRQARTASAPSTAAGTRSSASQHRDMR